MVLTRLRGQRLHDFHQHSHIGSRLLVLIVGLALARLAVRNNLCLVCFTLDSSGGNTELGEWSIKLICIGVFNFDSLRIVSEEKC